MSLEHEGEALAGHPTPSAVDVEQFVERGFVLVRQAIPPELVREMVDASLRRREPVPTVATRSGDPSLTLDASRIDFWNPASWGVPQLTIETGRALSMPHCAPKLWNAVHTLVGPRTIRRTCFGEQWILNGDVLARDRAVTDLNWHIDEPSSRTTLDGRTDALALLILWSDVGPNGGGTLYSGESLDHVVRLLEDHPDGVDTTTRQWVTDVIPHCGDVRELTGRAGDVLLIHSLALHAAQSNPTGKLRVLENPMIEVRPPLDYTHDNPKPSPVERCVLRRLRRRRRQPVDAVDVASRYLVRHHPTYFLPDRSGWERNTGEAEASRVRALDAALARVWLDETARRIERENVTAHYRLEGCVAVTRQLFVGPEEIGLPSDVGLRQPGITWAQILCGCIAAEARRGLLAELLRRMVPVVRLLRSDDAAGRRVVYVAAEPRPALVDFRGRESVQYLSGEGLVSAGQQGRGALPNGWVEDRALPERREVGPLQGLIRDLDPGQAPPRSLWGEHLALRTRHVWGRAADPAQEYQALIARYRAGGLTRLLMERLAHQAAQASGE